MSNPNQIEQQTSHIIEANGITKSFENNLVLQGVGVGVDSESLTLIAGPSGSGKTTLLNILGGIEPPDQGEVWYKGRCLTSLSEGDMTMHRGQNTGFAFQRSSLLNGLSVADNITYPHRLIGNKIEHDWADQLFGELGITKLLDERASNLSGGEKQRVALARAIIHRPDVVFADEPSAPLDSDSKKRIHELIRRMVDAFGVTIVLVSHDEMSKDYSDSIVRLIDGEVDSVL